MYRYTIAVAACILMLPPCAQTQARKPAPTSTLARLTLLAKGLPDSTWRYHAGDIAHGEDPQLDDSSWPVGTGSYETSDGAMWFRQTFTMPASYQGYNLRDTRVFFQFHAFAHGSMPEVLYVNGRRIAIGDNMEPVELVDRIVPGEVLYIAVKLLHSADRKHISPASFLLRFSAARPIRPVWRRRFAALRRCCPPSSPYSTGRSQS